MDDDCSGSNGTEQSSDDDEFPLINRLNMFCQDSPSPFSFSDLLDHDKAVICEKHDIVYNPDAMNTNLEN